MNRNFLDWATLALAAMGFALGVVNYVTDLFRRKPRAKVIALNYLDAAGRVGLSITVVNTGETPFTVECIGLVTGRNKRLVSIDYGTGGFPKVLHSGETCEAVIDRSRYAEDPCLKVKCAFARTAVGKEFYSKRLSKKFLGLP